MSYDWEEWELEDLVLNVPNEEQLKRLNERKLVEESDNALTMELFSGDDKKMVAKSCENETNKKVKHEKDDKQEKEKQEKEKQAKRVFNSQPKNELEAVNRRKEEKARKQRAAEIFGESDCQDEYAHYEDKFY
jgi:hypothetical protein